MGNNSYSRAGQHYVTLSSYGTFTDMRAVRTPLARRQARRLHLRRRRVQRHLPRTFLISENACSVSRFGPKRIENSRRGCSHFGNVPRGTSLVNSSNLIWPKNWLSVFPTIVSTRPKQNRASRRGSSNHKPRTTIAYLFPASSLSLYMYLLLVL